MPHGYIVSLSWTTGKSKALKIEIEDLHNENSTHEETMKLWYLPKWDSGIYLKIAPNDGSVERIGNVTIRSFLVESKIAIKQGF